jgi:hypothetical protein
MTRRREVYSDPVSAASFRVSVVCEELPFEPVTNRTERHNLFNGMAFSFEPFVIMYGEWPSSLQDNAP